MDQCAGNGHALQLAAAELLRQALAQSIQSHGLEHLLHALLTLCIHAAQQHQRQGDVLRHIEMRQHMKGLKHKAQMCAAPDGTRCFVQRGKVCTLMQHLALLPAVQPGKAVEEGGLAYARVSDDGDKLTDLNLTADLLENSALGLRLSIAFGQVLNLQQWLR